MTKQFHCYYRPTEAERAAQLAALSAFASQIGCPQRPKPSGEGWNADLRVWRDTTEKPTLLEEREYGAVMLRSLEDGDVLLCPTIADLADVPSNLAAVLRATLARGISVHFLELPGLTGAQLQPLLAAIAAAFLPLERARSSLQGELAEVQKTAERRLEVALEAGMAQMARNWGLPSALRIGMPPLGDVTEPAKPISGDLGAAITAARKAKGLTQAQLAKKLGISQPTLSRIEQTGEGENLPDVLDFLFSDHGGDNEAAA